MQPRPIARTVLGKKILDELPEQIKKKLFQDLWNIVNEYYGLTFNTFLRCPLEPDEALTDPFGIELGTPSIRRHFIFYNRGSILREVLKSQFAKKFHDEQWWEFFSIRNQITIHDNKVVHDREHNITQNYCQDIHTIIRFLANPHLNQYLPVDPERMDEATKEFVNKLRSLSYINIGRELQIAIKAAQHYKQSHIDLLRILQDFQPFPVRNIHHFRGGAINGDEKFLKGMLRFYLGTGLFIFNAAVHFKIDPEKESFSKALLKLFVVIFGSLAPVACYQDHKLFSQFIPRLRKGIGGREIILDYSSKKMTHARQLFISIISFATDFMLRDLWHLKLLNFSDHVENAAAFELMWHHKQNYDAKGIVLALSSLAGLSLLQFSRLKDFDNASLKIAAACAYPVMSIPRLFVNSHAVFATFSKAKKNPQNFFLMPPRDEYGVSCDYGDELDFYRPISRPYLIFIPLAFAIINYTWGDDGYTALAKMFFAALSLASHYAGDYRDSSPRLFTLPRFDSRTPDSLERVTRAQPG